MDASGNVHSFMGPMVNAIVMAVLVMHEAYFEAARYLMIYKRNWGQDKMIFGNPDIFALQFEEVKAWNVPDNTWINGLLCVYIQGARVFGSVEAIELRSAFSFFSNALLPQSIGVDDGLSDQSIYYNARDYYMGRGGLLMSGVVDFTATEMEDYSFYMYFRAGVCGDHLVWSKNDGEEVSGAVLVRGTVQSMIDELKVFNFQLLR